MKRALVAYSDSEGEASDDELQTEPPKKKPCQIADQTSRKKLPALPVSIYAHVDDPTEHQGRIRTHRHVDGLYAAYVYAAVRLEDAPRLAEFIARATQHAKACLPDLHFECATDADLHADDKGAAELHISLSRPIYISANQRDALKRVVRDIAAKHRPFRASFAEFAVLENDERARAFLVAEIGAGHQDFVKITREIDASLVSMGHEPYYAEPRFHASFAWWLPQCSTELPSSTTHTGSELLDELRARFSDDLRKVGTVDVGGISLRIGKAVDSWALTGNDSR
ncbi:hypothetical protein AURDEDRAFT_160468 [Auricularia subglabra TFB-10046 SS5]|nr:hypothetical protein AURDEDRAFT_160468 [Auricularia subglabra TFB-10046 SS5]